MSLIISLRHRFQPICLKFGMHDFSTGAFRFTVKKRQLGIYGSGVIDFIQQIADALEKVCN